MKRYFKIRKNRHRHCEGGAAIHRYAVFDVVRSTARRATLTRNPQD